MTLTRCLELSLIHIYANELIYFVQKALNLEYENVKSYLSDEENYAFLKEWEIFLNEGEFYRSKLFDVSLSRLGLSLIHIFYPKSNRKNSHTKRERLY